MPSINVSMENFQSDVVDASQSLPVVLLFGPNKCQNPPKLKRSLNKY